MVKRWLAGLLGGFNALNGLAMLMEGPRWYASMPGVPHTGPFNEHFVADVGAAFLAAGAALIARAWRPSFWPAAIAGAMFLDLHALIHVGDIAAGRAHNPWFDTGLVITPAALALWAALPDKGGA